MRKYLLLMRHGKHEAIVSSSQHILTNDGKKKTGEVSEGLANALRESKDFISKIVLVLIWDHGSWHISQTVRD